MGAGKGGWDGEWRMMRVVKVFWGGGGWLMVDDNESVEMRYGIVPCDTGSRWKGTFIQYLYPFANPAPPIPLLPNTPPKPLPLLPHKAIITNPRLFLWML